MSANLVAPTTAWETRRPPGTLPVSAAEVEGADGFWGLDSAGAADGFSVTAGGFEGIDTAAASGNTQRIVGDSEVIY